MKFVMSITEDRHRAILDDMKFETIYMEKFVSVLANVGKNDSNVTITLSLKINKKINVALITAILCKETSDTSPDLSIRGTSESTNPVLGELKSSH